jgi:hypothetical protein
MSITGGCAVYFIDLIIGFHLFVHFRWMMLPTISRYLDDNLDCATGHGIKCVNCGSRSTRDWGVLSRHDPRRAFICNGCGKRLYRSSFFGI